MEADVVRIGSVTVGPPALQPPAAASGAASCALEFGWVPSAVVEGLHAIGHWRERAAAVEALHAALLCQPGGVLLPGLPAFFDFLQGLLRDPNFKIAACGMVVLEELAGRVGGEALMPHLGPLAGALADALASGVQAVREAAASSVAALMHTTGPQPVLTAVLGAAMPHREWRAREEGLNLITAAVLAHPRDRFDYPSLVRPYCLGAEDPNPRVTSAALEGLALLAARLGPPLLQGVLTAVGAADGVKRRLAERTSTSALGLPQLDSSGRLQHQAHARPASARPLLLEQQQTPQQPPQQHVKHSDPGTACGVAGIAAALVFGANARNLQQPATWPKAAKVGGAAEHPSWVLPSPAQPGTIVAAASAAGAASGQLDLPTTSAHGAFLVAPVAAQAPFTGSPAKQQGARQLGHGAEHQPTATAATKKPTSALPVAAAVVDASGGSLLLWSHPTHPGASRSISARRQSSSRPPGGAAEARGRQLDSASSSGADVAQDADPGTLWGRSRQAQHNRSSWGTNSSSPAASGTAGPPGHSATSALPPGGGNPDLCQSVRAWQQQRQQAASDMQPKQGGLATQQGPAAVQLNHTAWSPGAHQDLLDTSPQRLAGVVPESDGRSGSLLLWRRQPKAGSASRPAAPQSPQLRQVMCAAASPSNAALAQPNGKVEAGTSAGGSPGTAIERPNLLQKLGSFRRKLLSGAGEEAALPGMVSLALEAAAGEHVQRASSGGWQIAASRPDTDTGRAGAPAAKSDRPALPSQLQPQQQQGEPGEGGEVGQEESKAVQQQPDSPSKAAESLHRLKLRQQQVAQRRRVWSAPIQPPPCRAGSQQEGRLTGADTGDCDSSGYASTSDRGCAPIWRPGSGRLGGGEAAAELAGAASEGSPARTGLQALRVRARTARLPGAAGSAQFRGGSGSSSAGGAGSLVEDSSPFSLAALAEVFGPDKALTSGAGNNSGPGLAPGSWSPARRQGSGAALTGGSTGGGSSPTWPSQRPGSFLARLPSAGSPSSHGTGSSGGAGVQLGSPGAGAGGRAGEAYVEGPLQNPEEALQGALAALAAANSSQLAALDWRAQLEALHMGRRLARHHPRVLLPGLHAFVVAAALALDALRSVTARLAIALFQDLVEAVGPALDPELEIFVPGLLRRAGQQSVGGRDGFLAAEADRVLAAMVARAGEVRAASALLAALAVARAPESRARAAAHLDTLLCCAGSRLLAPPAPGTGGSAPATAATLGARLLRAAVGLLDEGAQEARTHGKRLLWELRGALEASGGPWEFKRALTRLECRSMNKVWDVFEQAKPLPP